ncbi:MAG: hypothetical protein U0Q12_12135 [Vicinamibacterales bacterium]
MVRRVAERLLCVADQAGVTPPKGIGVWVLLHASFTGGRGYYGSPRIRDDFIEWGEHVSRKRIILAEAGRGLQARVRKRYQVTTDSDHDQPIADNLCAKTSQRSV